MAPRESPRPPRTRDRTTHHDGRRRSRNPDRESREYRESREHRESRDDRESREYRESKHEPSSSHSSQALSADSLAKLNLLNEKRGSRDSDYHEKKRRKRARADYDEKLEVEKPRRHHRKRRRRVVSGALLEEGNGKRLSRIRGGGGPPDDEEQDTSKRKKKIWIAAGVIIALLAIIIPVAIVVANKNSASNSETTSSSSSTSGSNGPSNSNLSGVDPSEVPAAAKGTYLDPWSWYETTDFNVTYTNDTVGGLPVMGLMSSWDDSKAATDRTPALNKAWGSYDDRPARGVNIGGWLSLEPFITPSFFNTYDSKLGIIDEWTLCQHLGPKAAAATLEKHYATFVNEQTFADIADAGLDHVRIPFSYWAVATYDGDPYVFRTSWRYLLRGIEWARKYGLRINLDIHGLPGSQNGWNHSGRQGDIGWLNGTDGTLNAQRSLDIHRQLSAFFAQPRYQNIIAFYGLANEPKMTALTVTDVLAWTASAYQVIRENGIKAYLVIGDGFMGLAKWQGKLQGYAGMVLDVHQYVIFNVGQIVFDHKSKVTYACTGWTDQAQKSMNTATGFGPTLFAEWSQADTDCATYLNNVGWGNRWTGSYNTGNPLTQVLSATCPTNNGGPTCSCTEANADPSQYSDSYKQFLKMFAEAQMHSFEVGWGWFYWTWQTESAPQWSYKAGLAAGILPAKAYAPGFNCTQSIPNFEGLPEYY